MKPLFVLAALVAVVAGTLFYFQPTLYVNRSASMPIGYMIAFAHVAPSTGSVVLACLPPGIASWALDRGYLARGNCPSGEAPLDKFFIADAQPSPAGLCAGGALLPATVARSTDDQQRTLPRSHPGTPAGTGWIVSQNPDGFDSRYFGPVPRAMMRVAWYVGPTPRLRAIQGACS
jgi:type IV secretory pathway protease TraF